MLRIVLMTAMVLTAGIGFAQETNTNAVVAPAPVAVTVTPQAPSPVKISGYIRPHYDVTFLSNTSAQKWGSFSFYYLMVKAQADILDNLKAEVSIDLGTFSGQRGTNFGYVPNPYTNIIETAFLQYKVDPALIFTAGRMWEFYAPLVFSQQVRDGASVSGSFLSGMIKYGFQVFNDTVLGSAYSPLMEVLVGCMPVKGLNLDAVGLVAANPIGNTVRNAISLNLKAIKMEFLPSLMVLHEFAYNFTTNTAMSLSGYEDYTYLGWQIGTVMPFVELFIGDANVDPAATNDNYMYMRFAAKWDVTPNFAVVPYIRYDFLKNGTAPADTVAFRLRMDVKF